MPYRFSYLVPCAWALALSPLMTIEVFASGFQDQEDALRLRLRNELRRADKPSAGVEHDIYAWVQGVALEYNSPYLGNTVGLDVGAFHTHNLDHHDGWSTRWYLDGYDSFSLYTASLKLKLGEQLYIRAGRMVTDSTYNEQDDIPLINMSSQRTQPSLSDAVLIQYSPHYNLDLYGMYRVGVYTYPDVSHGVHKTGPINPLSYQYDTLRPQYLASMVYHDKLDTYALSSAWQEDVSNQVMTRASQRYPLSDDGRSFIRSEWVALYAKLQGVSAQYEGATSTYVLGGKLTYANPNSSTFVAIGKAGPKFHWMSGVDTDISYTFELSIDRNHSDMWSGQVGHTWNLPHDTLFGVAQIATRGYEDHHNTVKVKGVATDLYFGYLPQSGPLKGFRSFLTLSKAREKRDGSQLGNTLNYFDVKMTLQYDFNLR